MQEASIFTKILHKEIPGEIIFEDDQSFVILTIDPLTLGHLLVIPKEQIDSLWDVEDPLYKHLLTITKTMAERLKKVYSYPRVGMMVEGFGVPHAHIHVFGLEEGIEPTIQAHQDHPLHPTADELHQEADRLRRL